MKRNYYLILGVDEAADPEQIHDAYRRLARSFHPDVSGAETTPAFLEVQEAWQTLGDAGRRRAYDEEMRRDRQRREQTRRAATGRAATGSAATGRAATGRAATVRERDLTRGGAATVRERSPNDPASTLCLELQLDPLEADRGGLFPLELPAAGLCPFCGGSGDLFGFLCHACRGRGSRPFRVSLAIPVPPGVATRSVLMFPVRVPGLPYRRLLIRVLIMESGG